MARPHRLSDVTNPGDEPVLMEEGFEIVEEGVIDTAANAEISAVAESGSAVAWILLGILVTAVTASVLLVGLPMYDEVRALRSEKLRLGDELKSANAHRDELIGEVNALDTTRARLTATVAQKTVALEDADRTQQDLARKLNDEIQRNEAKTAEASAPAAHRTHRSRRH